MYLGTVLAEHAYVHGSGAVAYLIPGHIYGWLGLDVMAYAPAVICLRKFE